MPVNALNKASRFWKRSQALSIYAFEWNAAVSGAGWNAGENDAMKKVDANKDFTTSLLELNHKNK